MVNKLIWDTTCGTKNDNQWQRITTNGNEWYNKWYNEWQRVILANFTFLRIREEPTTEQPQENSLNLEEDLEEELLN